MNEQVKGVKELKRALDKLEQKIRTKILRTELRGAAKELAADVKENAPVGETGKLRRAVRVKSAKRKKGRIAFNAQIGEGSFKGETFYGSMVELGTAKQPAQHFMEQTFEAKASQIAAQVPQRIMDAIKKGAK